MKGRQHLTIGICGGAALALADPSPASFGIFAAAAFGELYPDIDIETSMIGHVVRPVSEFINRVFGHRGFIHTPFNACFCTALLYALLAVLKYPYAGVTASAFLLGFLAHLFQDVLTTGGIKVFWPIPWRVRLTKVKASSDLCWVMTAAIFAGIVLLFFMYPDILQKALSYPADFLDETIGALIHGQSAGIS